MSWVNLENYLNEIKFFFAKNTDYRYKIMPINDTLMASETEDCCEGYTLVDGDCRGAFFIFFSLCLLSEVANKFNLDPVVLSRFVTAIGLLILACLVVAVVSMLIAYKMFYKRRGKADQSER